MEIIINSRPSAQFEQQVTYSEAFDANNFQQVTVSVIVAFNDSRTITNSAAKTAARALLVRALEAHDQS